MILNFKTSIEGDDDEGIEFAKVNREELVSICEMLAPTFVGMIKSECRRIGIVADKGNNEVDTVETVGVVDEHY